MAWLVETTQRHRLLKPTLFAVVVVAAGVAMVLGWTLWVLLLAVLVPLLVAVAQRPQRGVLVFVALVPFDGLRALGTLPGVIDGWKQAFIVVLLVLTFVCPAEARASEHRRVPSWVSAFVALLALGLLSAIFVGGTTAVVGLRISYFDALIAVVIWRCPFSRKERDQLVTVLLAVGIVTSLVGVWQQIVGHASLHELGYEYDETIRFTEGFRLRSFSTFNQPFPFALFLMVIVLLVLPFALSDPKRLRSKVFFLATPLFAAALVLTYVRAAFLGLAIGLLYLAFHRYKILVYGIPLVLVAMLFIPTGTSFTRAFTHRESLTARTTSWDQRFELLADNPLGSGIGTTGAAAEKAAELLNEDEDLAFQPDNSYLKFELGVLGLWLFVVMLITMFLYTRDVERRTVDPDRHLAAGFSALLLAVMAASTVATYFEMVPEIQLFWVMTGVIATVAPRLPDRPAVTGPTGIPVS